MTAAAAAAAAAAASSIEQLGKNKFVDVREFKGMVLVDIREYYEKDGEMRPGKKGIALSAPQWEVSLRDRWKDGERGGERGRRQAGRQAGKQMQAGRQAGRNAHVFRTRKHATTQSVA